MIARPEFLFGSAAHDALPPTDIGQGTTVDIIGIVTPAQRLGAVGWVVLKFPFSPLIEGVVPAGQCCTSWSMWCYRGL